jgi:CBS domain containing-hemolysin-like protein
VISTIVLILFAILLIAISISLAAVEAAFYLVKRRRLAHLAVNNPRAELVNRYLEDPPSLLMPIHIGTYTAHVGITVVITAMFLERLQHWAIVVAFGAMVLYLLLLRLTLPYSLVRREPGAVAPPAAAVLPRLRPAPESAGAHLAAPGPRRARLLRGRRDADADARGAARARARSGRGPPAQGRRPLRQHQRQGCHDPAARHRRPARQRDRGRPHPPHPRDEVQPDPGLRREPGRHRRGGHGARPHRPRGPASAPLRPLVRAALVVPETKKIAELLQEFQAGRITFAVVIDEYGGTAGLVTVEDIVEEIVGEIKDEYDLEAEPIVVEPDGAVLVAGRVNVDRLEQALEVPLTEGDNVDTVGGLVAAAFGRVPRTGERIDYKGFTIEVVSAEHKRVNRVRFRRKPAEAEAS